MKILWNRVAIVILGLLCLPLVIRYSHALMLNLEDMRQLGTRHGSPDERDMGLFTLAVIVVLVVALAKLAKQSRGPD